MRRSGFEAAVIVGDVVIILGINGCVRAIGCKFDTGISLRI